MITIEIIVVKIIMHNMILIIIVIIIIAIIIIIIIIIMIVDKVLPVTCLHTRPVCGTAGTGLKKQNHFLFCFRFNFVKCTNYFLPLLLTLNFSI